MAKVFSKLTRRRMSLAAKRRDPKTRDANRKPRSLAVRKKISKTLTGRKLGPCPIWLRKKISKALKGKKHPWHKGKTYEQIYGKKKAKDLRKNRSESQLGRIRPLWVRKKLVAARSRRVIPFLDTGPELAVARFLEEKGFKFSKHGLLKDCSHQFDFVLRALKLAIEVDGCWWHGCKVCNSKISQQAKEQKARDRWWEKKARNIGWRVTRIWEHDTRAGKFEVLYEALGLAKPQKEVPRGKGASIR